MRAFCLSCNRVAEVPSLASCYRWFTSIFFLCWNCMTMQDRETWKMLEARRAQATNPMVG